MSHPVQPDAEDTHDVFRALMETLPEAERPVWLERWRIARSVERRRYAYDRSWDDSLMGVTRWGQ